MDSKEVTKGNEMNKITVSHRVVLVAAVDDRVPASGTAFNTNTGRPELWFLEHLPENIINTG